MDCIIREIRKAEYPLLEDFLYEAIFIPPGSKPVSRSVIHLPALQVYIHHFGDKKDDRCTVAEVGQKVVGAVWTRIMDDYGHIDGHTPSLAMSVYKEYRHCGIGTALLKNHLSLLKDGGYEKVSLSVQKTNYALKMYQKAGFDIVDENEEEYIMDIAL